MSLDINQLAEALDLLTTNPSRGLHMADDGKGPALHLVFRAARLIVSGEYVPKGQAVRWCIPHNAQWERKDRCWRALAYAREAPGQVTSCLIVDGYLHLPDNG